MPSKLILMRHGQSIWNQQNLFTGWVDIPLSEKGVQEAILGGQKIRHLPIDVIFTSTLVRAHMTLMLALLQHESKKVPVFQRRESGPHADWSKIFSDQAKENMIAVHTAWELNERMYGQLQGLNKAEMAQKYGEKQVQIWRRSYDVAPPDGESLAMTIARALPYFQKQIIPYLERGENVLISAHGNSLRGIVMHLDRLSEREVVHLEIPTGEPIIYTYDKGLWNRDQSH